MDILDRLLNSSPDEGSHELQCRCLDAAAEIARQRDHISILEIAFRESQAKLWELMDIGNDLTPNARLTGAEPVGGASELKR